MKTLLIAVLVLFFSACGVESIHRREQVDSNCYFPAGEVLVNFQLLSNDCPKDFIVPQDQSGNYVSHQIYECGIYHAEGAEAYEGCVKEWETNTVIKVRVMQIDYIYNYHCPTFECKAMYHELITSDAPNNQLD